MAKRTTSGTRHSRRYRVHFSELNYYQSVIDAESPDEAIRLVQESPPELTFVCCEERTIFGIDALRSNKTWQVLPDHVVVQSTDLNSEQP